MIDKAYCKCKKCGYDRAEVDTSIILTSYPPLFKYKCPKCGEIGYIYANDDCGLAAFNSQPIEERLYGHCLICGELVQTNKTQGEVICDECKEAIKWAKKQINNSPSPNWEISDRERAIMFGQEEKIKYVLKNQKCADMYKLNDDELNTLKEYIENDNITEK